MILHKIRAIVKSKGKYGDVYGITIPDHFRNWFNVNVNIQESGNCLILESGNKPEAYSKKELNKFSEKIEVIRI